MCCKFEAKSTCRLHLADIIQKVDCFQSVVTEHPPLSCKEASMYLCFCKGKDLQNYFAECAYSKCGDNAQDAVNFGVSLCKGS